MEDRRYWRVGWKKLAFLGEMISEDMLPVLEDRLYWSRLEEACLSGERILEDILPCLGDVETGSVEVECRTHGAVVTVDRAGHCGQ